MFLIFYYFFLKYNDNSAKCGLVSVTRRLMMPYQLEPFKLEINLTTEPNLHRLEQRGSKLVILNKGDQNCTNTKYQRATTAIKPLFKTKKVSMSFFLSIQCYL